MVSSSCSTCGTRRVTLVNALMFESIEVVNLTTVVTDILRSSYVLFLSGSVSGELKTLDTLIFETLVRFYIDKVL